MIFLLIINRNISDLINLSMHFSHPSIPFGVKALLEPIPANVNVHPVYRNQLNHETYVGMLEEMRVLQIKPVHA